MNTLTKTLAFLLTFIPFITTAQSNTSVYQEVPDQQLIHSNVPKNDPANPFKTIYKDTIESSQITTEVVRDSILDPMRVVTNKFGKNWFVFATGGGHTFQGDYSRTSVFQGTLSPDWSVGIGKWFTPGIALKLEFIKSESRGYTEYLTGHYGYGPIKRNRQGIPFRDMKTGWWDISGSVVLNLTRLFIGYEGMNSKKHMNQFMFAGGFGGVHHTGFEHSYGSDNEWAGHVELQYSRFFTPAKRFSLDFKFRGLFYQTNFDLEYGLYDSAANKWDMNLGFDLGFTYYLGLKRANGWSSSTTQIYQRDFRQLDVLEVRERVVVDTVYANLETPKHKRETFVFYVFYPNNYSGRNDAPNIPDATVNAIDYLAGGIFTQKKFSDTDAVMAVLNNGGRTTTQPFEDLPTESASQDFEINFIPRGYEMDSNEPMSLSTFPNEMNEFKDRTGFYYAPIWDGLHEWHYRIDDATLKQQLVSSQNYYERETYGLNARQGLNIVRDAFKHDDGTVHLVSFADVYAALHGNTGHIAKYTDPKAVETLKRVFADGLNIKIELCGIATSQDNYSGADAHNVGLTRNTALATNRANTVKNWLNNSLTTQPEQMLVYTDGDFAAGINKVTHPSTRGLVAKLNRCVKVKVSLVY